MIIIIITYYIPQYLYICIYSVQKYMYMYIHRSLLRLTKRLHLYISLPWSTCPNNQTSFPPFVTRYGKGNRKNVGDLSRSFIPVSHKLCLGNFKPKTRITSSTTSLSELWVLWRNSERFCFLLRTVTYVVNLLHVFFFFLRNMWPQRAESYHVIIIIRQLEKAHIKRRAA